MSTPLTSLGVGIARLSSQPTCHLVPRRSRPYGSRRPVATDNIVSAIDEAHASASSSSEHAVELATTAVAAGPRRRLATLKATKYAAAPVEELDRPLATYMTLPASQYSVLDAKRIERLDEDTFRCYVGGLHFLNFHVEPVLTLSVVVGDRGPTVRLLDTQLRGSKAVEEANKRFTATMSNVVRWRESESGDAGKEIASNTTIEVTLELPGWFVLPVSVVERSGCAVMQRVLDTAVPRFLEQLKKDYALWAAGDESRKPVANDELL